MNVPWFFCERVRPDSVCLEGDEARHARAARRLSAGDEVVVFDGRGGEARGRIAVIDRRRVEVIVERVDRRPPPAPAQITVATAMPKARRQDFLIEKCTELGVAAIWPIVTERSVVRPDPSRTGKWRRTSIEAAKQSHHAWLPEIHPPTALPDVAARADQFDLAVIAEPATSPVPLARILEARPEAQRVLVLIGPEGGFSPAESSLADTEGIQRAWLGATILRTETAALVAVAVILAMLDRNREQQEGRQ